MAKRHLFNLLLLFVLLLAACSTKKESSASENEAADEEWKPMDDFHIIMAESFHPYRDSADLGPAKANSDSLVAAAQKWIDAPIPSKVDNPEVKEKLQQLKQEADGFAILAKTDDDKATGEALNKLHDLFHSLQEEWYEDHGSHEEHH